jgi:hypothetical protein
MISTISSLFTVVLFGVIGWLILRKANKPSSPWFLLVIIAATVVARYVGVNARLIQFGNITVFLNDCLQGLGFGVIIALALKESRK